jgi:hypothetical protein
MLEFAHYAAIELFRAEHAARTAEARRWRWLDAWLHRRDRTPPPPVSAGSFRNAFV